MFKKQDFPAFKYRTILNTDGPPAASTYIDDFDGMEWGYRHFDAVICRNGVFVKFFDAWINLKEWHLRGERHE